MGSVQITSTPIDYIPILIQMGVALAFAILTIVGTHLIGPKVRTENKLTAFESGVEVIGNARQPFSVKYFMAAILFVLFDVEVIFMYPWAVNFREMGMDGLWKMGIFLGILVLGLIYEVKRGAIDWD